MAKRRAEMMAEFEAKVGTTKPSEQTANENENQERCTVCRLLSSGTAQGMMTMMRRKRRRRTGTRMKN